ncbi:MAG: DUF1302 family protein [Acidocella sp.]|nr:DUF1302 family protein [Acidocella sp.]
MNEDRKMTKQKLLNSTAFGGRATKVKVYKTLAAGVIGGFLASAPHAAYALNLYDGEAVGNNLEINLDTTISYTGIVRTGRPSYFLTKSPFAANGNDGDNNFSHGLVSNGFEITPTFDLRDGDFGAHFSADAYVNTSYLGTNQNHDPYTNNSFDAGVISRTNDFTSATRNVEGLNAQVLDAFAYKSFHFGADDAQTVTVKFGRQTLIWGQSLFLSNNGIAAGMAPFNVITADNNPNAETQQIIMPVGQAVLTYQPNQVLTLQGYYQFEWQPDLIEATGSYFSSADLLGKGGASFLLGGPPALRSKDLSPEHQNGQFGASAQLTLGNYDVGFYALRFDSKAPSLYVNARTNKYYAVYPRDIWIEGTSLSTTVGPANVAGEISFRQHMPLVDSFGSTGFNPTENANSNPGYPVGDTWAGQMSAIYVSPGVPLDPGGITMDGEIGFNHLLKVTRNAGAPFGISAYQGLNSISQGRTSTAVNMEAVVTPNYYDVLPNLSLGFPIGLSYNIYGRSAVDATENHGTGNLTLGVTTTYKVTWVANVTFNDYIGRANPLLAGESSIADRNYVLFNLQHSF